MFCRRVELCVREDSVTVQHDDGLATGETYARGDEALELGTLARRNVFTRLVGRESVARWCRAVNDDEQAQRPRCVAQFGVECAVCGRKCSVLHLSPATLPIGATDGHEANFMFSIHVVSFGFAVHQKMFVPITQF